jgi:hypothetical protein
MTDKESMKLALEALETLMIERGSIYEKAIAALKERLAQPEPIQSLQCFHCQVTIETLNDKVMHLLAQRKPLTEEQIWKAIRPLATTDQRCKKWIDFSMDEYRAIEAAHGIKENT